jgi:hypothetical protein
MSSSSNKKYSVSYHQNKNYCVCKWKDVAKRYIPLCHTTGATAADRELARRIEALLTACEGIPTDALEGGYIETLKQSERWRNEFIRDRNS